MHPIFTHVERGRLEALRGLLLAEPASVHMRNDDDETPLHVASARRAPALVEALLAAGADPDARDGMRRTPLHGAAFARDGGAVRRLLAAGADPDAVDSLGDRPLTKAGGWPEGVALLREAGAVYDLEARLANGDEDGLAALLRDTPDAVAAHPDRERLKDLAGQGRTAQEARRLIGLLGLGARPGRKAAPAKPSPPEPRPPEPSPPEPSPAELLAAAEEGKAAAVRKLLDADAALLAAVNDDGDGPLHLAAWQGHRAVVTLLLERGAPVDAAGAGGQTPLHYAVRHGQAKVVKALLDAGADPARRDEDGTSAWYAAALAADDDTVRVLDRSGHAPDLDAAVTLGRLGEVERCLAERPDAVRAHPDPARLWSDARAAVELAAESADNRASGLAKARALLDRLVAAGLPDESAG